METTAAELIVTFETDEAGKPKYFEAGDRKNYHIILDVENAPLTTYAVTYWLDPETYYDPMRTLKKDPEGKFQLKTTTYGDYNIEAELRTTEGRTMPLRANLTRALRASRQMHGGNPAWDAAIEYIGSH